MATMLYEELALNIQDELEPASRRLARLVWLLHDFEKWFGDGDVDLGANQPVIELGLELASELAYAIRRDLTQVERICARELGEDDMEMAA